MTRTGKLLFFFPFLYPSTFYIGITERTTINMVRISYTRFTYNADWNSASCSSLNIWL